MNSLNHENTQALREAGHMLAYLKNQLSLAEIEQTEDLMEADPLYELAMEQLAVSLDQNPALSVADLKAGEQMMGPLLAESKEVFVNQPQAGKDRFWNQLPVWQKALAGILLLVVAGIFFFPRRGPVGLHKAPALNLVPDEDVRTAEIFDQTCIASFGIGRNQTVTLQSAFVEHYSMGNYAEASRQFELLQGNAELTAECKGMALFYLAKSLMAQKAYEDASRTFGSVLRYTDLSPGIRNACHWYLANLYLLENDHTKAKFHLEELLEFQDASHEAHLPALLFKTYLEDARQYLADLSG
jgi:tetratricopeptide (TPR) repeat protein